MGTKATQYSTTTTTSNSNKISSSTWILNWLSQLTKSSNNNNQRLSTSSSSSSSGLLPWKKDVKSRATTSIVITEPPTPTLSDYYTQQQQQQQQQQQRKESFGSSTVINRLPRPSITISNHSERRNSQCSSSIHTTSDDQYSYYNNRRGSNSSSVISELWSKAKRHHKHPKFHWPHRRRSSNNNKEEIASLKPSISMDYDSLPSSYRQPLPKHLKRHSISSSFINNNSTNDNTPLPSRPNSIIYSSQPASPHFAAYLLNNDIIDPLNEPLQQQEIRWEVKHELTKLAVDGLFSIPQSVTQQKSIEKHILQIGCGSDASWAMEVASKYPKWIVIGLDHYQFYYHNNSTLLRNYKFIKCVDMLQALKNFPDGTFDFIASRFLITSYTFEQYQLMMNECIRITKPGGYIEVMEMDLRIYHQRMISSSVTTLLNNEVIKVIESKNLDPRLARRLQDLITSDVSSEIKYISLPLGVWGGKLGVMFRDDVHSLIESFQEDIADQKDKKCRTEDELDYKVDIMDNELDSNRAFMNLHIMVVYP